MFQQRQINDVMQLLEVSTATIAPGAVTSGSTPVYAAVAFAGATFALGDQLEIFPSAAAATNGVLVSATPTATPGTAGVYFQNTTGGTITPTSAKYTIVATRITPTLI